MAMRTLLNAGLLRVRLYTDREIKIGFQFNTTAGWAYLDLPFCSLEVSWF